MRSVKVNLRIGRVRLMLDTGGCFARLRSGPFVPALQSFVALGTAYVPLPLYWMCLRGDSFGANSAGFATASRLVGERQLGIHVKVLAGHTDLIVISFAVLPKRSASTSTARVRWRLATLVWCCAPRFERVHRMLKQGSGGGTSVSRCLLPERQLVAQ